MNGRSKLLTPAALALVLSVPSFSQDQSSAKGSVQVSAVSISIPTLHLSGANGPKCGTATVQVYADRTGEPGMSNPKITVGLVEYSSNPAGATVEIAKDGVSSAHGGTPRGTVELTTSSGQVDFEVCATGAVSGSVIVQTYVFEVTPTAQWTKRLLRRNRGWSPAQAACQVSDTGRVREHGRCESRRIFS
jgi:hypothetical protein